MSIKLKGKKYIMKKLIFLLLLTQSFVFAEEVSLKKSDYRDLLSHILVSTCNAQENVLKVLSEIHWSFDLNEKISLKDLLDLLLDSERYTFLLSQLLESFKEIKYLNFYDSNIENFPKGLSLFINLESLAISNYRKLRTLPDEIESLKNLKYLRINGTPIEFLPKGFASLKKLTEIKFDIGVLADCIINNNIDKIDNLPENLKKYGMYRSQHYESISVDNDKESFIKSITNIPGSASFFDTF